MLFLSWKSGAWCLHHNPHAPDTPAAALQESLVPARSARQAISRLLYRAIVLAVVIIPLAATGLAIWLLWNRAVSWRDLILLA